MSLPGGAGLAARPLVVAQVGEGDRLLGRRRVALRDREHERVAAQLALLERRVARARRVVVLLRQHHVDVASRSAGSALLGLGLHELALQLGVARLERAERGDHERVRGGLEGRDPHAAGDRRRRSLARSASAASSRAITASAWTTSRRPASVSCTPRPTRSISAHAGVALERRELLGDGGRRVGERLGDRRDRAPGGQLAQQPQAADVEHREAGPYRFACRKMSLDLNGRSGRHCAP